MKPFNLQEALAGKPVVTRDGHKVTELHYFETAQLGEQLVFVVDRHLRMAYADGRIYRSEISPLDLFMVGEPREIWLNIYPAKTPYHFAAHPDRDEAERGADGQQREALIKVTLLDGKATAEVIS